MTFRRTPSSSASPRQPHAARPPGIGHRRLFAVATAAVTVGVLFVACGVSSPTSTGTAERSASPSSASETSQSGATTSGPTPQPTRWPAPAVTGITGLGAGDTEIAKAVADFSEAVAAEDL